MTRLNLRLLLGVALVGILLIPAFVEAQSACDGKFEGSTVRLIVSTKPGGGYDTYSRLMAPHYAKAVGARVIVENWPGGKGLIGARKITSARPDGLTFGLIAGSRFIASKLLGDAGSPDILKDFHVFVRVARSRHVWFVSTNSDIDSVDQILIADPPKVYGATSTRSPSLMGALLISVLLEFDFNVVFGLGGAKHRALAVIRGVVDFTNLAYSSILSDLESGEIKAILQVSSSPIADHRVLKGVPLLGGETGIAAVRARQLGVNVREAIELAAATEGFLGAGRLLVGPAGFEPGLADCIEQTLLNVLDSDAFRSDAAKLKRPLDVAGRQETVSSLTDGLSTLDKHIRVIARKTQELAQ